MKVLVTGASGLLGSRLMQALPREWSVTGTCHAHARKGLVQCDLTRLQAGRELLAGQGYSWLVHCAANRNPDDCQADPRKAVVINAEATEWLCFAAADEGCRVLYVSTDYVFPGTDPPYREESPPQPLNAYGHSKLVGEEHALGVPGGLVVRVPALYSLDTSAPNNLLGDLSRALTEGREVAADADCVRHYTLAEDVAAACRFLMEAGRYGVVHVSADEPSTKYEFLCEAAGALGGDPEMVVEKPSGQSPARRPHDSHLDSSLYRSLRGPQITNWRNALRCLRA